MSSTFMCRTFMCNTLMCSTFICSTFMCSTFMCSTFLCSTFIPKIKPFMRYVRKYGTANHATDDKIIQHMRIACWIPNATNTHSFSPLVSVCVYVRKTRPLANFSMWVLRNRFCSYAVYRGFINPLRTKHIHFI